MIEYYINQIQENFKLISMLIHSVEKANSLKSENYGQKKRRITKTS